MRIAVGNNHRGYRAKLDLLSVLKTLGHQVEDFGCHDTSFIEYPDVACPLAEAVGGGECACGPAGFQADISAHFCAWSLLAALSLTGPRPTSQRCMLSRVSVSSRPARASTP